MDRLVAFGCSNTYGEGLSDCWEPRTQKAGRVPSKFAWPNLVAKQLEMEVVNLSIPGASNKHILDIILHVDFLPTDKVVIMWTYEDRFCFFKDGERLSWSGPKHQRILPQDLKKLKSGQSTIESVPGTDIRHTKYYYENLHTCYDARYESTLRINYAKYHLDRLGLKNFHVTCDKTHIDNFRFSIINPKFIEDLNIDCADDKSHPGILSQQSMAKQIIDLIQQN